MAHGPYRGISVWLKSGLLVALAYAPLNLPAHGNLEIRIAALSHILATNSSDSDLYFRRAELYRLHNQYALALADYQHVLALKPCNEAARLGLGEALLMDAKPMEARVAVETCLRKQPANPEALLIRARILVALGENQKAVADYSQALCVVSWPVPEVYLDRAALLASMGKIEEALAGLDDGVKRLGHVPPLELRAVKLELCRNCPDAALNRLNEQIARAPRKEFLLCRRATILEKVGRLKEARACYQAVLEAIDALTPNSRNVPAVKSLLEQVQGALNHLTNDTEAIPPLQPAGRSP
jgi:tetratricopeptide (TPR) repeat protein